MDEKQRRYGERYPLDEDFLVAMAQMPEASGVALGFDRLVMLASGAVRLDQVCGRRRALAHEQIDRKSAATLRRPAELIAHGLVPAADLPDLERLQRVMRWR